MRDRVQRRFGRRIAGISMVAALASAGFVATAPPASADPLPGSAVTAVTAGVGPDSPLWSLDVTFTVSGVTCPAEIHYVVSSSAGSYPICGAGQTVPNGSTVTIQRPVFSASNVGIDTLTPGSTAPVKAAIYAAGTTINNNPPGPTRSIAVPPAPVWIGLGDGYTSAVNQVWDGFFDPVGADSGYEPNDNEASWISAATDALNGRFSVPGQWKVTGIVIAQDGTTAQGLAAQIAQMETLLEAAEGSWNWVGVSAGLVDAGIPAAIQDWYEDTYGVPVSDPGGWSLVPGDTSLPVPWEAADASECVDLTGALSAITANGTAMKAGRQAVVTAAKAADPSVRVINVLYPYLTEETNDRVETDTFPELVYTNPCAQGTGAANNRDVIDALNTAIDVGESQNVFTLDLRSEVGFGDRPTGTRIYQEAQEANEEHDEIPGGVFRPGSFLQLTRPYGYPYPTGLGAIEAGTAAVDIAIESGVDATPPTVTGTPMRTPDKNGWYNHPVDITWSADDGLTGAGTSGAEIPITEADAEGRARRWSSPEVCDIADPPNCAVGYVDLSTDFTGPNGVARRTNAAGQVITPNGLGWFKDPVTVRWEFVGTDNLSGNDPSTIPTPQVVSSAVNQLFSNPANTLCDIAGNCITRSVTLNVDPTDPVITGTPTAARPPSNGWYRDPVTIAWTTSDQGGSGVNPVADPADTVWAADAKDKEISAQVCDRAGRCATAKVTISLDQTKPTVEIAGAQNGGTYSVAPTVSCVGSDSGSGLKSCELEDTITELPDGFEYEVKATATDNAGNVATKTITFTQIGFNHVDQTWVTGNASHTDAEHDFVTYAFRLRCTGGPNAIHVNWDRGLKFRLDDITSVLCYDNPTFEEGVPLADADSFVFTGTGRYNDDPGATIQIRITDEGEIGETVSGVGLDTITIIITAPGGQVVLNTTAVIEAGNLQANGEDIDEVLPEDPEEGEGTYAIFASAPTTNIIASGIPVRGAGNSANVYSGLTANGNTATTRTEVAGAADIQGDLHARGGVLVGGSAQIRGDVWASGNVVIDGAAIVHGNVVATGSITLVGSGKILGSAIARGSITLDGGARISGDATANGSITHPSWGSPTQFVGGTKTPNAGEDVDDAPVLDLPTPPAIFDGNGWPEPYREFATCASFNSFLNANNASGQANRNDFRGTYRVLEGSCSVIPGTTYMTVTLTGPSAIVANGCIETQGSAKFVRPAQSTAELWLLSLRESSSACSGDNRGIKLAGGSWLSSVPTFLYAKNEAQVTGGVTLWGQIYAKTVKLAGGFALEFKPFKLPCFSGEAISSGGDCSTPGGGGGSEPPAYEWADGGVFVVGNQTAYGPGGSAYYWGSQWKQNNPVSGSTHNSFKGFQNTNGTPECGGTWSTDPGNSSGPPASVPEYMAVVVSSYVNKSGSTLSGDVAAIVIVKTQAGYGPAPGHVGVGSIVQVLCEA